MPFVTGPNGFKFEVSADVAASLLVNEEFRLFKPREQAKPAAPVTEESK